jgi:hypothetical protein
MIRVICVTGTAPPAGGDGGRVRRGAGTEAPADRNTLARIMRID